MASGFTELVLSERVLSSYFSIDSSADGSSSGCKIQNFMIKDPVSGLKIE